jgi:hypothetical protein
MTTNWLAIMLALGSLCWALLPGCTGPDVQAERFGKVFYLDGGGNWGFGVNDVPGGLRRAGYKGDIEVFNWSRTLNPALDQINSPGARAAARDLARKIMKYKWRHPDNEVNVIGLSAGTGVAVWALEYLSGRPQINNLFLMGSSLSSDYELRRALASVRGKVYNYYSSRDAVLSFIQLSGLGTIDRQLGVEAAGQVGFQSRFGTPPQVVNIGWEEKWSRLGWNGAHTDYVNDQFIQYEVARKLMEGGPASERARPQETGHVTADPPERPPAGAPAGR